VAAAGSAREAALPFLEALRAAPPAIAQSRLLNTADRDLGVVLHALGEEEVQEVLRFVGAAKAGRLREEIARMLHVRLEPETIATVARHLAAHLGGDRPLGPASRYFRPRRDLG